jgi:cell division cycle protein 20 (cofactor of APC complex)
VVLIGGEAPEGSYVSLVGFSNEGAFLGIRFGSGEVGLWDVESGHKLRSMGGHQVRIVVQGWHGHILVQHAAMEVSGITKCASHGTRRWTPQT